MRKFNYINADEVMKEGGGILAAINQCKTEFIKKYGRMPNRIWLSESLIEKLEAEVVNHSYNSAFPNVEVKVFKVLGMKLRTDEFLVTPNIFCELVNEEII